MGVRQVLAIIVILATVAQGRVFYLQNLDGNRYNEAGYPFPQEQSSRDLDLSFAAGDPREDDNEIRPVKKVYTLVAPEKPFFEVNRDTDSPTAYYKLIEPAARRPSMDDVIVLPEKHRKLVKLNGNNKGEVILELRVIANHDSA